MTTYAATVLQAVLTVVFLQSFTGKITHIRAFVHGVREYDVLPRVFAPLFGFIVVLSEMVLGIVHATGAYLQVGAALGSLLFLSFLIAIVINIRRGREIPCYCLGGEAGEMISPRSVVKLTLLIIAEGILVNWLASSPSSQSILSQVLSVRDFVVFTGWVTIVFLCSMWIVRVPDLWVLASRLSDMIGQSSGRTAKEGA